MTELDPVIHAPARLRIMTALAEAVGTSDQITFPRLRELLDMTAGNLTTHLAKLEDAGYVQIEKAFAGKKPVTYISLTKRGDAAFTDYRTTLLRLIGGPS